MNTNNVVDNAEIINFTDLKEETKVQKYRVVNAYKFDSDGNMINEEDFDDEIFDDDDDDESAWKEMSYYQVPEKTGWDAIDFSEEETE